MTRIKYDAMPFKILRSLLIGSFVLSVFTADQIELWSHDLPASAISDQLIDLAKTWRDATHRLYLDRPHATLRSWMRHAEGKTE